MAACRGSAAAVTTASCGVTAAASRGICGGSDDDGMQRNCVEERGSKIRPHGRSHNYCTEQFKTLFVWW